MQKINISILCKCCFSDLATYIKIMEFSEFLGLHSVEHLFIAVI
jgi:hypothetical protein